MPDPPRLVAYPVEADPPPIEPARASRPWMDATDQRFAYRCIPLSIANLLASFSGIGHKML